MSIAQLPNCLTPEAVRSLKPEKKLELLALLKKREQIVKHNRIDTFYPEAGPLRRELYPRHLEFFAAGAMHRERMFLAANRVGKTEGVGAYETTLHLTGRYPAWWQGRRFDKPVRGWAAGETGKTTRDIVQLKLLGKRGEFGTGMIPAAYLRETPAKSGIAQAVEMIYVEHVAGGLSRLVLKSYDQGVDAFAGTEQELVWLDEEPPMGIYTESLVRTMTTGGIVMTTFMPLNGQTELIKSFMPSDGTEED